MVTWIRAAPGETVTFTVERDGKTIDLPVTIGKASVADLNDPTVTVQAGYLGVSPVIAQVRQPVTAVPARMWDFATLSGKAVLSIPSKMAGVWRAAFSGDQRDVNGPVSVVGVGRFSAEVADDQASIGWKSGSMLLILASLNMALFLFNLIPLLPLDGGHVAGALYEGRQAPGRKAAASARSRASGRGQNAAGCLHRRRLADRDVRPADLRRHRQSDPSRRLSRTSPGILTPWRSWRG